MFQGTMRHFFLLFVAVFALVATVSADDYPTHDENWPDSVTVGQSATFEMSNGMTQTYTVKSKDADKIVLSVAMSMNGTDMPPSDTEIPLKSDAEGGAEGPEIDYTVSGEETISVDGKDFTCSIVEYEMNGMQAKAWVSLDLPPCFMGGQVKSESTMAGNTTTTTLIGWAQGEAAPEPAADEPADEEPAAEEPAAEEPAAEEPAVVESPGASEEPPVIESPDPHAGEPAVIESPSDHAEDPVAAEGADDPANAPGPEIPDDSNLDEPPADDMAEGEAPIEDPAAEGEGEADAPKQARGKMEVLLDKLMKGDPKVLMLLGALVVLVAMLIFGMVFMKRAKKHKAKEQEAREAKMAELRERKKKGGAASSRLKNRTAGRGKSGKVGAASSRLKNRRAKADEEEPEEEEIVEEETIEEDAPAEEPVEEQASDEEDFEWDEDEAADDEPQDEEPEDEAADEVPEEEEEEEEEPEEEEEEEEPAAEEPKQTDEEFRAVGTGGTPTKMLFVVTCTGCGAKLKGKPEHRGKVIACPKCKAKFRIPE